MSQILSVLVIFYKLLVKETVRSTTENSEIIANNATGLELK